MLSVCNDFAIFLRNIRNRIISLGGVIRFDAQVTDVLKDNGKHERSIGFAR